MEALKVLTLVVGHWRQPARPQFRFDLLRVPRLDAPTETVEGREARGTWRATATAATPACLRLSRRRRRRRLIPPAQDEAAQSPMSSTACLPSSLLIFQFISAA